MAVWRPRCAGGAALSGGYEGGGGSGHRGACRRRGLRRARCRGGSSQQMREDEISLFFPSCVLIGLPDDIVFLFGRRVHWIGKKR
jgi:hypothetical protein